MRRLTINGRPVAVWFEQRDDMTTALSKYCTKGYSLPMRTLSVTAILETGDCPILDMPIEKTEETLKLGYAVLYITREKKDRHGIDHNHHLNRLQSWRKQYPGLVAFGSRKDEGWKILPEHSAKFEELGYS